MSTQGETNISAPDWTLVLLDCFKLPVVLIDQTTLRICSLNQASRQYLKESSWDEPANQLNNLFSQPEKLAQAITSLNSSCPAVFLTDLTTIGNDPINSCLTLIHDGQHKLVLVFFWPNNQLLSGQMVAGAVSETEEVTQALSRQLNWERSARQVLSRLHTSLDRDALLQNAVDLLGKGLGASCCFFAKTDGSHSPSITHEYVEANISPLGLGGTNQFSPALIEHFRHSPGAFSHLMDISNTGTLDGNMLAENGISALMGAPVAQRGKHYGVVVILQCGIARYWTTQELEMMALVAKQTAIALSHCESFMQVQDQLFNLNLLSNVTQQLTDTLALISHSSGKPELEEKATSQEVPLSYRELEVLKLIASGFANREIAKRLFLTESTVELHASRIRKKLKLKSRTALVKYACDHALV